MPLATRANKNPYPDRQALTGRLSRLLAQLAHNASRIADCQTICGNILGYYATGSDSGVVADGNAGKDDRHSSNPHILSDGNWRRWRRRITLVNAMPVIVEDKRVMTQQATVADFDLFVSRNR
jgi:hypothetical protein